MGTHRVAIPEARHSTLSPVRSPMSNIRACTAHQMRTPRVRMRVCVVVSREGAERVRRSKLSAAQQKCGIPRDGPCDGECEIRQEYGFCSFRVTDTDERNGATSQKRSV
jgi:hypothetical protein